MHVAAIEDRAAHAGATAAAKAVAALGEAALQLQVVQREIPARARHVAENGEEAKRRADRCAHEARAVAFDHDVGLDRRQRIAAVPRIVGRRECVDARGREHQRGAAGARVGLVDRGDEFVGCAADDEGVGCGGRCVGGGECE
ncbi:hypothetical protein FHW12_004247 [Dokdonella fugitiva]|uniref:Uncharacterized protein n=1 Tax=Dokdonella fugitiva TaxID=328517 RepID=A0A839FA80_9GAMM|nr:hypothetical protein [Dokdonella fugitiva]MBA8890000.1 hypothetical protein [Dokdonella fugitiva]